MGEGPAHKHDEYNVLWPSQDQERLPDLVGPPKDPLREIYLGRWRGLPTIQKFGVAVELLCWLAITGSVAYSLARWRNSPDLWFLCAVLVILLGFFGILARKIR